MKRRNIIIAIVAVVLLAGAYFYVTNSGFKAKADDFIANNITGKDAPPAIEYVNLQVYMYAIADGTGSTFTNYAVPQVRIDYISNSVDRIHYNNGGKFWLSYIDRDSRNNQCLYFSVPASVSRQPKPEWKEGQNSFSYQDSTAAWETRTANFSADSTLREQQYETAKQSFLKQCEALLTGKVYVKHSRDNLESDVVGSLNSAFKTFSTIADNTPSVKYIVAFSDLQQDAPSLIQQPKLGIIPDDLHIISVNPQPGSSKRATDQVIEVPSSENVSEIIFSNLKIQKP